MEPELKAFLFKCGLFACLVSLGVVPYMIIAPRYGVYTATKDGEAKLAHANSEREVQVRDAQGRFEASTLLAKAEVERAKGVAEANRIIGDSLKNNESYLRYLWIHNLGEGKNDVIYVPTEAGLPILEAGKRGNK